MTRYRVFVLGKNVWVEIDNELTAVGFYVTRIVEARDRREAQAKGLDVVAKELEPKIVPGTALGVRLIVESCEEMSPSDPVPPAPTGFVWFTAEDDGQQ